MIYLKISKELRRKLDADANNKKKVTVLKSTSSRPKANSPAETEKKQKENI